MAGLLLAFGLTAAVATAVGVAAWSLGTTGGYTADRVAQIQRAAYQNGMRQAGIREEGCPDLLVVAADGGRQGEAALARAVDAAFTRRNREGSFASLDHFDDARVADLRLLAERRWGRLAA